MVSYQFKPWECRGARRVACDFMEAPVSPHPPCTVAPTSPVCPSRPFFPSTTMSPSSLLPVLTLPNPLVLLPTARIQLSLDETVGTRLIELVQRSEVQLVIGTVPCTSPTTIHPWGTAARVVRVVRPISRSSQRVYHVTLHGLSRIHFPDTTSGTFAPNELIELRAEYPPADGPPSPETIAPFRTAASKLLDSLAQDATQQSRRDVYVKISHMIEEVSDDRAPWLADVIVAGINKIEYADKLGEFQAFDHPAMVWSGCGRRGVIRQVLRTHTPCHRVPISRRFGRPPPACHGAFRQTGFDHRGDEEDRAVY